MMRQTRLAAESYKPVQVAQRLDGTLVASGHLSNGPKALQ